MATVGFIASTIPAKVVRDGGPTLFHVAMLQTGDPLQWPAIALLNDVLDPWAVPSATLIPPVLPGGVQTGILTPIRPDGMPAPATGQSGIVQFSAASISEQSAPVIVVTPPPPPPSTPDLDFSAGTDSMYIGIFL